MTISHVIIDANILYKDYRFTNRDLIKLTKTKELYNFKLCLPQVVYDELVGRFRIDFDLKLSQLTKLADDVNKFVSERAELNTKSITSKFARSAMRYRARLDNFIKKNKIIVLPYPKIPHEDVVKRIYSRTVPFIHENSEKGYKDFLITQSIFDYFEKHPTPGQIILYTANAQDFVSSPPKEKTKVIELDTVFGMENVALALSSTVLFQELRQNLKDKHKAPDIFSTNDQVAEQLKMAISAEMIIFDIDILGDVLLSPKIQRLDCNVLEYAAEIDEDKEMMEISGIVKIDITCSFNLDEWDFQNLISPNFLFIKEVREFIAQNAYSKRDEWSHDFKNLQGSSEFIFNYIDFDFRQPKSYKEITFDPMFLSISKI